MSLRSNPFLLTGNVFDKKAMPRMWVASTLNPDTTESKSGMMPVTDHFDERLVLQCMEYCNGFDTFQYLFDLIDLLQC